MTEPDTLKYEKAPPGSPDRFRLTEAAHFKWANPPAWIWGIIAGAGGIRLDNGYLVSYTNKDGKRELCACVFRGFYFAISVAPSFARALPAGCLHDWLYAHADELALHWGCPARTVLHIADHWFLANMRATNFLFKRSYFTAVRMLGYWFNRLFAKEKT